MKPLVPICAASDGKGMFHICAACGQSGIATGLPDGALLMERHFDPWEPEWSELIRAVREGKSDRHVTERMDRVDFVPAYREIMEQVAQNDAKGLPRNPHSFVLLILAHHLWNRLADAERQATALPPPPEVTSAPVSGAH